MYRTLSECQTQQVLECYDAPIKYKPAYAGLLLLTFAAPYIGGPLIRFNEKKFTRWGWVPYYKEVTQLKKVELI